MAQPFTVIALLAARNENDIIGQVIEHLVQQGLQVYVIDDGSTDGTTATIDGWRGRGVIGSERREPTESFDWTAILQRKQQLAETLMADWFIHHDADEFRLSPFPGTTLHEAIRRVDALGYNAIDFRVLNFRPTAEDSREISRNVQQRMLYYEVSEYWDAPQIKAWKRTTNIDLAASGGHQAEFEGRHVFPIQFLLKHYPVRSQRHGETKVFQDRQPRFAPSERARGWHVQYDTLAPGHSFVRDPATLTRFDEDKVLHELRTTHRDTPSLVHAEARLQALRNALGEHASLADRCVELQEERDQALRLAEVERVNAERDRIEAARVRADEHAAFEHLIASLQEHARNLEAEAVATGRQAADDAQRHAAAIQSLTRELADVYASRSWRVTAPLRWALGLAVGQPAASPHQTDGKVAPVPSHDLTSVRPVSDTWGTDRGRPIDRFYIEAFLVRHAQDIHGAVWEIKDPGYTTMFGGARVRESVVVDIDASNAKATLHADLTQSHDFPAAVADCFILTQTVHIVFDYAQALRTALKVLKPGGVLLCTAPAVSRVNYEDGGLERGDFWRFTGAAIRRVFAGLEDIASCEVQTFGNVRTCAGFLYGLATEDMPQAVLDFHDPWFPLVHCVRVVKRA